MDVNTENFQKFIIRKIVKSIDYNADKDTYTFNYCQLSDELIAEIIKEGSRYDISEKDVRQYISITAHNIKTQPQITSVNYSVSIKDISFGQHIRIEFRHPEKGDQWIECIKLNDSFLVLSSSIGRLEFGTKISPTTDLLEIGYYTEYTLRSRSDVSNIKGVLLKIGELTAIKFLSPSIIHKILDSPRTYQKQEKPTIEKEKKKKETIKQKANNLLYIIDLVYDEIKNSTLQANYDILKSQIIDIGLSSYTLNTIIDATKKDYEKTLSYYSFVEFDQSFFTFINGSSEQELNELKEKFTNSKKEYNATIKKNNLKEGCFIATIAFMTIMTMGLLFAIYVLCGKYSEEKDKKNQCDKEKIQTQKSLSSAESRIKKIAKYTLTTGARCEFNKTCDSAWILWLNANEKVCLESFSIRAESEGIVKIGVFTEEDNLIKQIDVNLTNNKFQKVDADVILEKGRYYMRICNGKSLQYHPSSDNEYEHYMGGFLEVTGACHYDSRKNTGVFKKHDYYQYFYDIKYHLISN